MIKNGTKKYERKNVINEREKHKLSAFFFCGKISGDQNYCLTGELIQYLLSTDYIYWCS
jgi:hypothetical protein